MRTASRAPVGKGHSTKTKHDFGCKDGGGGDDLMGLPECLGRPDMDVVVVY